MVVALQSDLVQVEINLVDSVIQVVFTDAKDAPPYRIENHSFVPVVLKQKSDVRSVPVVVHPGSKVAYSWDDLTQVGGSAVFDTSS